MTIVRHCLPLVLALAASACTDRRADSTRNIEPAPADAPPTLTIAHEAYLAGDYVEMGERLKDVIVDPRAGELARDNAFALLESAYEATRGQLPARTALPSFVKSLTFGVLNGANPSSPHRLVFLNMRVSEGRLAHLKDIRLTRLPSEPILALADKRGALRVSHAEKGIDNISIDVRDLDVLPQRGAFSIQVVFDDGPGIDTFVLANKLVASALPELTSPDVGQVFNDGHPEITWIPYRSPEFASWEQRAVAFEVSREKGAEWNFYKFDPGELGSVRVGGPGTRAATLEPDSYFVSVMCSEERVFGGVRISRSTHRGRHFNVAR